MGLLGDVYSYGDTLKRKVGGLLSDPRGTLEQFVGQLGDDMNTNISNMKTGYGFGGNKSVLSDPAQVQAAQRALADYGAQSGMAAATVWHGSPHKFDKFDSSKIGSGEGSQAYGHGLYVADNPTVANSYRAMAGNPARRQFGLSSEGNAQVTADALIKMNAKQFTGGDVGKLAELIQRKPSAFSDPESLLKRITEYEGNNPPSFMYKVDLPDEHIAKMLDWDKPLSQQPQGVQAALAKLDPDMYHPTGGDYDPTELGQMIYQRLAQKGQDAAATSMRGAGIPGIRYLDGGSRGAGQGSSNFVVFPGNEGLLSILERNNKALDIFKDTAWEPPLFPDTTR